MPEISAETAQEYLDQFIVYYDIDLDDMADNIKKAIEGSLRKIKRAIMAGRLEIEFSGETKLIKQHLINPIKGAPNPIVYKEITGKAKIGIRDDSSDYGKMYSFLGALCGEGVAVIQNLSGPDLSLAESLGVCFLQV